MGVPVYPVDLATKIRQLEAQIRSLSSSTLTVNVDGRPWTPAVVVPSTMPATTSSSFTSLQNISSFKSHNSIAVTLQVTAPAAGSEVRLMLSDGVTLVYGPTSVSSGTQTLNFKVSLPGSISTYADFTLFFQARSLTAGQTTSGVVLNAYCRS